MAGIIRMRSEGNQLCKICNRTAIINFKCKKCYCVFHVICAIRVKEIRVIAYNTLICPECISADEFSSIEFFKETCENLSFMILELHDKNQILQDNKALMTDKILQLEEIVNDLRERIEILSTHDYPKSLVSNDGREIQAYKEDKQDDWDKNSELDNPQNNCPSRNLAIRGLRDVGLFQIANAIRSAVFAGKGGAFRKFHRNADSDSVSKSENDGSSEASRKSSRRHFGFKHFSNENTDSDVVITEIDNTDSDVVPQKRRRRAQMMKYLFDKAAKTVSAAGVIKALIWIKDKVKDWAALIPPTALAAGAVYTVYLAFCPKARGEASGRINKSVQLSNPKVVDTIDVEDIAEKAVFCRCWKSKNWPYCDGSHAGHNTQTADNVGPVIVKKNK